MSLSNTCLSSINTAYLNAHNKFRANHNAAALKYNSQITDTAQKYANYLATNNIFEHSGTSGLGENLAYTSSSKAPNLNDCSGFLIYFATGDVFLSFLLRLLNIIVLF